MDHIRMVLGRRELRPIEFDGVTLVTVEKLVDEYFWVLPGGYKTDCFDVVRDYCIWVRKHGLHLDGKRRVTEC